MSIRRYIETEQRVIEIIVSMPGIVEYSTSVNDSVIYFTFWHSEEVYYAYAIKDYMDIENLTAVCESHNKEFQIEPTVDDDSYDELFEKIFRWGIDKGIIENGKPISQAIKSLEEVTEMFDAINTNDSDALQDAVGDVVVTLLMVCGTSNIGFKDSIVKAYNEIKDRKGYLREDGTFIKEDEE